MKNDDVISHLQIIHTWASFAYERGDILRLPEIHKIMEWTDDALELLKEQQRADHEVLPVSGLPVVRGKGGSAEADRIGVMQSMKDWLKGDLVHETEKLRKLIKGQRGKRSEK